MSVQPQLAMQISLTTKSPNLPFSWDGWVPVQYSVTWGHTSVIAVYGIALCPMALAGTRWTDSTVVTEYCSSWHCWCCQLCCL